VQRSFSQVDVFTHAAYLGNPVAVVLGADGLDDATMQRVAAWTNLSETTFVLRPTHPDAHYAVRIFTPSSELPFAGHPTLGTCHAWLESLGDTASAFDTIVQECAAGLVRVRRRGDVLSFAAPPLVRSGPVDDDDLDDVCRVLGIGRAEVVDAAWADNGPGWMALMLRDAEAVLAVHPAAPSDRFIGLVGLHPPGAEARIEVRALFPARAGVLAEDPVTGSLNASVAQWLLATGRVDAPYVASQGAVVGRRGRVHVDAEADGTVWVGGGTITCVRGTIEV
jgi:PhzF family phenazine biosynthesis protein